MAMTALWGDDSDDTYVDVMEAALALIDEAYPVLNGAGSVAPSPPSSRPSTSASRRTYELRQLREQVAELELLLAALHSQRQYRTLDGSNTAALWAQVAHNQLQQRSDTVEENTRLKACARTQRALARQLCRAVDALNTQLLSVKQQLPALEPMPVSAVSVPLARRLDAIEAVASPRWMGLQPSIGSEFRDRWAQLNSSGDGLQVQYRYAGYVPFKLSLVASEVWEHVLTNSFGTHAQFTTLDQSPNEAYSELALELSVSEAPRLEIHGPSAMRRVYTADGSVVFAATSIASGSVSVSNLTEGFQLHEVSWLRIGRAPTAPSSLVYIESFCHLDVIPTRDDSRDCANQLERMRVALLRTSEVMGPKNTQDLENRLLDATRRVRAIPPIRTA